MNAFGVPNRGRCLVMGILNVTPDSFSDGGLHLGVRSAVQHGLAMAADGADIVDIGGESTRPGADRTPEAAELARVLPVVAELAAAGIPISIDTMRSRVAAAAIDAGASIVNDVSGGLADPAMAGVIAQTGVAFVAMHWRAHSRAMGAHARYGNVVDDVVAELRVRVDALLSAGIAADRIVLDPGLGFAKTAEHNWELLSRLDRLTTLGYPVVVGPSRKSFLGAVIDDTHVPKPPRARDGATAVVCALAATAGASCVRVHDVTSTLDAVRAAAKWHGPR